MFIKYQHIEKWGTDEVEGIEFGTVHIQPKIDGTNGVIWKENGEIKFGSRRKEISEADDNQGFCKTILNDHVLYDRLKEFFASNPFLRLYGEFLIPHSLRTYRKDTWNKFYIFDVGKTILTDDEDFVLYISYDVYKPILEDFGLEYIPVIATVENGSYDQFIRLLDLNNYLIEDGKGTGEGLVLKRYEYRNKYGRQTWAKIVKSEFKEIHAKTMGGIKVLGEKVIEKEATEKFLTAEVIEKIYQKIIIDNAIGVAVWNSKFIPRLLDTVYYEFVTEEIWHIVKEFKGPMINFGTLKHYVINKIKEVKPELF